MNEDGIPTASDVVHFLNERFEARGLPYRLQHVPQLAEAPEQDVIEEEIREARWRFPQVLEDY